MSCEIDSKPLRPRYPVKVRIIEAALYELAAYDVSTLSDENIIWRALITRSDFDEAYSDRQLMLQDVCWQFFEETLDRHAKWALDHEGRLTVRERFEAVMKSLNLGDNPAYFARMSHLIKGESLIWPIGSTINFNDYYFKQAWIDPLHVLYSEVMDEPQAKTLATLTGNQLHQAANDSGYAISKMLKELRITLPSIYESNKAGA